MYFSENQVPNIIDLGQANIYQAVSYYNEVIERK